MLSVRKKFQYLAVYDPKAFMSSTDLFQLYLLTSINKRAFGIVISPRIEGAKVLCVRLTDNGFKIIQRLLDIAEKEKVNPFEHVTSRTHGLRDMYCQFEFRVTEDPCHVVDFCSQEDVLG